MDGYRCGDAVRPTTPEIPGFDKQLPQAKRIISQLSRTARRLLFHSPASLKPQVNDGPPRHSALQGDSEFFLKSLHSGILATELFRWFGPLFVRSSFEGGLAMEPRNATKKVRFRI